MYQHTEGPKFGDCEDEGVDLHTQYFKNAFKGKSASPNYQKRGPKTLSMDPPSAKASPLRTGLEPLVQKSEYEGHANRGEPRGSSEVWSKVRLSSSGYDSKCSSNTPSTVTYYLSF
jgi:hypothetical protein